MDPVKGGKLKIETAYHRHPRQEESLECQKKTLAYTNYQTLRTK